MDYQIWLQRALPDVELREEEPEEEPEELGDLSCGTRAVQEHRGHQAGVECSTTSYARLTTYHSALVLAFHWHHSVLKVVPTLPPAPTWNNFGHVWGQI